MNQIILVGRIAQPIELHMTETGKKKSELTLAVPRTYKNIDGEYLESGLIPAIPEEKENKREGRGDRKNGRKRDNNRGERRERDNNGRRNNRFEEEKPKKAVNPRKRPEKPVEVVEEVVEAVAETAAEE